MYDPYEYGRFVNGVLLTIELGICCLLLSVLIGISAPGRRKLDPGFCGCLLPAISAFRNTPPIVQLLFFYFALGALTPKVSADGYSIPIISAFDWLSYRLLLAERLSKFSVRAPKLFSFHL